MSLRKSVVGSLTAICLLFVSACAGSNSSSSTSPSASGAAKITEVTVVTHDSFKLPDKLKEQFTKETGYKLKFNAPGDAGALVNQLILTKDAPLGDVVFGIDNTFADRAIKKGVLTSYKAKLPVKAQKMVIGNESMLTPIDYGDVCLNADKNWFEAKKIAIPQTLDDLTKPEYKNLLAVINPATSSPGLAFLMATIGDKGDPGYLDYWAKLKNNGVKVASGWTEAYSTLFSGSTGKGPRPLVVSYSTSPAFEVKDGKAPSTTALLKTCFRQTEYAGVLAKAKNEAGAKAFIDFMLSKKVQAKIPENMYMYPVADVQLPPEWVKFAPLAEKPIQVSPAEINANRERWIKEWTIKVTG